MNLLKSDLLREQYWKTVHPSGLPIYVFPKPMTTTYAIFASAYGSLDTSFRLPGQTAPTVTPAGVAHFLEHKLFENPDGSDSFENFSRYGADANAYTTYDRTAFLFSCTDRVEESLAELLRFVTTPHFTAETVHKEQGIIAEEIRMYRDSPWERCFQNLMEGMYQNNPVRVNICGTESSISRITPEMLYQCYRAFYQLSNMVLIVCGNVTPESVLSVADRILSGHAPAPRPERTVIPEPRTVFQPSVRARMQVSKPIFTVGIKDPDIPSQPEERLRRDACMSILNDILFARSGSLYSDLFEEGLITPSWSYGYSITDRFAFHSVSGESSSPEAIADRIRRHMERTLRDGIPLSDFERCRRIFYADAIRSYDSTEEIANTLLNFHFDGSDPFRYPDLLNSIRPEELPPLLEQMLDANLWCHSVVDPL